MDTYSAKSASTRILQYVDELSKSDKSMYNSSRLRLSAISANCETITKMIDDMLSNSEVVNHPLTDLSDSLNMAYRLSNFTASIKNSDSRLYQSSIERLKQLNKILLESVSNISAILCEDISDENFEILSVKDDKDFEVNSNKSSNITKQDRKSAIQNYYTVITNTTYTQYNSYNRCKDLICAWFRTRFMSNDKTFRYNIKNLPEWLKCFVCAYGSSLEAGKEFSFIDSVENWLKEVETEGSSYVLPYNIFRLIHQSNESDANLASMLLWNMLFNNGFCKFHQFQPSSLYPDSDDVYMWNENLNPSIIEKYVPVSECSPELLKSCNII